jgi:hypothetical protein
VDSTRLHAKSLPHRAFNDEVLHHDEIFFVSLLQRQC